HVEAIARAIDGDAAGALEAVKAHCAAFPRDALVLQLNFGAFGLISFAGRREHDEEMWEFFKPFVSDYGDDWWFRFAWGWAHTESGRIAEGRRLMDQAFTLNPRNANAVHGIALLWRLMLDDKPVAPGEWTEVAAFARERFPSTTAHFHELHCLMAWAAAGEWAMFERRVAELRDRVAKGTLNPGAVVPALAD